MLKALRNGDHDKLALKYDLLLRPGRPSAWPRRSRRPRLEPAIYPPRLRTKEHCGSCIPSFLVPVPW